MINLESYFEKKPPLFRARILEQLSSLTLMFIELY